MTNSSALRASSCVGELGELTGETVFDLQYRGGYIDFALISGLLRLRLMVFIDVSSGGINVGCWSSKDGSCVRGRFKVVPVGTESGVSSVVIKLGSTTLTGNVWLRGLLEDASEDELRDWLIGVNGLSDTRVDDDGLVTPADIEDVVSSEVALVACVSR